MQPLLFAVLAHWLVTMYLVEAEITRPLREWVGGLYYEPYGDPPIGWTACRDRWGSARWRRPKLKYLVTCRMCTGFWVGLAVGLLTGLNPLVVAALSHWLFITQRIAEKLAK